MADRRFPGVGALLHEGFREYPRDAQIWALEYSVSRRIIVAARFRAKLHNAITLGWSDLRRQNSGREHGWPGWASGDDAATDEALQSICEPARILWRGWRRTELEAGRSPGRCIIQGGTLDPALPTEMLSDDFRFLHTEAFQLGPGLRSQYLPGGLEASCRSLGDRYRNHSLFGPGGGKGDQVQGGRNCSDERDEA